MKAAVTGQKQDISVVNYILGTRAQYAANSYKTILKQIGRGVNLTNTAIEVLSNIQSQIEETKTSLIALNNTNHGTLQAAEKNYQNQWDQIFSTLKNTEFAGKKLFDGTFAKAPEVRVAAHNLPEHAHPYEIQLNSSDPCYKVSIPIPRLFLGEKGINTPSVDGTYTSIVQASDDVQRALRMIAVIRDTRVSRDSTIIEDPLGHAPYVYRWDGIDETGSFGEQLRIIRNTLPEGVNAAIDLARRFCIHDFRRFCTTIRYARKVFIENATFAAERLACAKAAARLIFIPNIANSIPQAINEIALSINAVDNELPVANLQQRLRGISNDQSLSPLARARRNSFS